MLYNTMKKECQWVGFSQAWKDFDYQLCSYDASSRFEVFCSMTTVFCSEILCNNRLNTGTPRLVGVFHYTKATISTYTAIQKTIWCFCRRQMSFVVCSTRQYPSSFCPGQLSLRTSCPSFSLPAAGSSTQGTVHFHPTEFSCCACCPCPSSHLKHKWQTLTSDFILVTIIL